jgi:hypothetical protein
MIAHDGIFGFTSSGDVYRSVNFGTDWSAIGTINQVGIVGATPTTNSLFAITEQGDLAESIDMGVTWDLVSTVSQIGMTGLTNINDTLYVTTREGDVASSNNGSGWNWEGTASQVYIGGIGSDEMSVLAIEEVTVSYEVCPEGIRLRFTLNSSGHTVIQWEIDRKVEEDQRTGLATVSGERNVYLDMDVEGNVTYTYWIIARFVDGEEKEVGPFVITYPQYTPVGLSIYGLFPRPVRRQFYLVIGSSEELPARVVLHDVSGRYVSDLWSGKLHRGYNRIRIDIEQDETAIFFVQVISERGRSGFEKVVVIR